MFGFIALNKPSEITSHDCVARVRKILKISKVGHGGTLDPLATGVLPIAVGKATRLLQFLPENKSYRALIRLGVQTTTDDLQGEVVKSQSASILTLEQVEPLLHQFIGTIQQTPPIYSAMQRDGKRLYSLARQGKT
ncbi:MAG: tRNA pseudouridine(55) synthase TruB, partial [cyanobacterium endosymbiont of Rhopalodia yunnanensis]